MAEVKQKRRRISIDVDPEKYRRVKLAAVLRNQTIC